MHSARLWLLLLEVKWIYRNAMIRMNIANRVRDTKRWLEKRKLSGEMTVSGESSDSNLLALSNFLIRLVDSRLTQFLVPVISSRSRPSYRPFAKSTRMIRLCRQKVAAPCEVRFPLKRFSFRNLESMTHEVCISTFAGHHGIRFCRSDPRRRYHHLEYACADFRRYGCRHHRFAPLRL